MDHTITFTCRERQKGKRGLYSTTHKIEPLILSSETLRKFYEQASKFPVLFGHEIPSPGQFASLFISYSIPSNEPILNGLFWSLDDLDTGIFYLTDIFKSEATAHFAFFDQILEGREQLVYRMMEMVFEEFGFNRLNIQIPTYVRRVHTFAKRVGCRVEGLKRDAYFHNGKWWDAKLYGVLKREILQPIEVKDGTDD